MPLYHDSKLRFNGSLAKTALLRAIEQGDLKCLFGLVKLLITKIRQAYESRKNIALAYKEERMQQAPNHRGAMEEKKREVSSL